MQPGIPITEDARDILLHAEQAHHAFEAEHGTDTNWPAWYADYFVSEFTKWHHYHLARHRVAEELKTGYELFVAESQCNPATKEAGWAVYLAIHLVNKLGEGALSYDRPRV